jgi:hypothetical protein
MNQIEHPSLASFSAQSGSTTSALNSASVESSSGVSTTTVLIIILVSLIGVFVFLKIQPYLSFLSVLIDYVRSLLNGGVSLAANTTKNLVDQTAEGSNIVVEKVSGKKKPKKNEPEPDDATSIVQNKGAYCYVGEWKGVRSCVRIKGKCESGETFESEQKCAHPELR